MEITFKLLHIFHFHKSEENKIQNMKRLHRYCKIRKQISGREIHTTLNIKYRRKNRDAMMGNSTHASYLYGINLVTS